MGSHAEPVGCDVRRPELARHATAFEIVRSVVCAWPVDKPGVDRIGDALVPMLWIADRQDDLGIRVMGREFAPEPASRPINRCAISVEDRVPQILPAVGDLPPEGNMGGTLAKLQHMVATTPSLSRASLSDSVPVRPKPAPITCSAMSAPLGVDLAPSRALGAGRHRAGSRCILCDVDRESRRRLALPAAAQTQKVSTRGRTIRARRVEIRIRPATSWACSFWYIST